MSIAFFSFIALFITAGTVVLFGERLTNPADIVERVDNIWLTIIAAITFFAATVGINLVANFIPPAYDIANLAPSKISAKTGGVITAVIAFFIGALWVSLISTIGIAAFVDTLGAFLAPLYGILVADYYLIRKQRLNVQDLFSNQPGGNYYYDDGWNKTRDHRLRDRGGVLGRHGLDPGAGGARGLRLGDRGDARRRAARTS